jgi:protein-S-isoprenylcysteine O-methyltransferase Ste14
MGALIMGAGVALFAWTHRHLGPNYHALVAVSPEQTLVTTGPYQWMRHPMYTASLLYDLGCGFLSANLVLTLALPALLVIHVALRVGWEEQVLVEYFGAAYQEYVLETPRFFPHSRSTH